MTKPVASHSRGLPLSAWSPAAQASFLSIYPTNPLQALLRSKLPFQRPRTVRNIKASLELFAGSLQRRHPSLLGRPIEAQLTREAIADFVAMLSGTNRPQSVVDHLGRLLAAAERLRLCGREVDIGALTLARDLVEVPHREKIIPEVTTHELDAIGYALMERARLRLDSLPADRCSRHAYLRRTGEIYRDGLLLCLAAFCPLRLANLEILELDTHIRRSVHHWRIVLSAAETKNNRPMIRRVPDHLRPAMDLYVERFRPLIQHADQHRAMWPSRLGGPLSAIGIYRIFVVTTRREIGRRARPHDARRSAGNASVSLPGTSLAAAQDVLAHAGLHKIHRYVSSTSDSGSRVLSFITGC